MSDRFFSLISKDFVPKELNFNHFIRTQRNKIQIYKSTFLSVVVLKKKILADFQKGLSSDLQDFLKVEHFKSISKVLFIQRNKVEMSSQNF